MGSLRVHLDSLGFIWVHLGSLRLTLGFTWDHSGSLGCLLKFTWVYFGLLGLNPVHYGSLGLILGFTLVYLGSLGLLGFTGDPLGSNKLKLGFTKFLVLTWAHSSSLGFTWVHLG